MFTYLIFSCGILRGNRRSWVQHYFVLYLSHWKYQPSLFFKKLHINTYNYLRFSGKYFVNYMTFCGKNGIVRCQYISVKWKFFLLKCNWHVMLKKRLLSEFYTWKLVEAKHMKIKLYKNKFKASFDAFQFNVIFKKQENFFLRAKFDPCIIIK